MKKFTYKNKKFGTQKELFAFLYENEKEIVSAKKGLVFSTPITSKVAIAESSIDKINALKAKASIDGEEIQDTKDIDIVNVIIVGNAMNYMDDQDDVLINDSFKKTLQESQGRFKHLADHNQRTTGKIGIPNKVYLENMALRDLGLQLEGETQCLIMDSNVLKCYNENLFYQYLNNDIDQHSVGIMYVKLFLCVNDPENADKFKNWNTYFNTVINKDDVLKQGYFFAVTEVKLLEVSAVLWGSNELTPTIATTPIIENDEPSNDTQKSIIEPLLDNTQTEKRRRRN